MATTTHRLLAWLGLFAIYAAAFAMDRASEFLRRFGAERATPQLYLWSWSLGNLVLAVSVLALITLGLSRMNRTSLWAMLIIGLLFTALPFLYWLPFGYNLPLTNTLTALVAPLITARSYLVSAGALTAAAAFFRLLQQRSAFV